MSASWNMYHTHLSGVVPGTPTITIQAALTSLQVCWSNIGPVVDRVLVELSGGTDRSDTVMEGSSSFSFTGLDEGTSYTVSVTAENSAGSSGTASEDAATEMRPTTTVTVTTTVAETTFTETVTSTQTITTTVTLSPTTTPCPDPPTPITITTTVALSPSTPCPEQQSGNVYICAPHSVEVLLSSKTFIIYRRER